MVPSELVTVLVKRTPEGRAPQSVFTHHPADSLAASCARISALESWKAKWVVLGIVSVHSLCTIAVTARKV